MSQNRGEYSCLFTFKRDKHHLNSRTGQCRQNSIPNLIFRQKFPNFYPKQETKSINDYIQRHSFPFLIMPQSHDGDDHVMISDGSYWKIRGKHTFHSTLTQEWRMNWSENQPWNWMITSMLVTDVGDVKMVTKKDDSVTIIKWTTSQCHHQIMVIGFWTKIAFESK